MKTEQDYIRDIAEIRSMMERSSKFLSLSGWAGIMAGIYALAGAYIAYKVFGFNPDQISDPYAISSGFPNVIALAILILILAVGTAIAFSYNKAKKKSESVWNAASRRILTNMGVPLLSGGVLIIILISKDLAGLLAPLTLVFYGIALYNAGNFTYNEVKFLGIIQIVLGLISSFFISYGLILWAAGFGVFHIIYGIYIHFRYER